MRELHLPLSIRLEQLSLSLSFYLVLAAWELPIVRLHLIEPQA